MSDAMNFGVIDGTSGLDQVSGETWERLVGATADLISAKAAQINKRTGGYEGLLKQFGELIQVVIGEIKTEMGDCCGRSGTPSNPFADILKNAGKGAAGDPMNQLLNMLKNMDGDHGTPQP